MIGREAASVGQTVHELRRGGDRVAGYVGDDQDAALQLAEEMLGGVDEVVRAPDGA